MTSPVMNWRRIGSEWQLLTDRRVLARVVPDVTYAGMWRVKLPGGLSDLVNLTRAKDTARLPGAPSLGRMLQKSGKKLRNIKGHFRARRRRCV